MRRISVKFTVGAVAALVALACLVPGAGATVTLGQVPATASATNCVGGPVQFFSVSQAPSLPPYTVPGPGLLTSWSTTAGKGKGQQMVMKVYRPLGGGAWLVVGHDGPRSLAPQALNSFSVHMRVQAGDVLGLMDVKGSAEILCEISGAAGDLVGGSFGDNPDGQTFQEGKAEGVGARLDISAVFLGEPRIAALEPASGSISGGTSVSVSGAEFAEVTGVAFGGVAAQSFHVDSEGQISAVAPPASRPGPLPVTVSTAAGTGTAATRFTYEACVVPRLVRHRLAMARVQIRRAGCRLGKISHLEVARRRVGRVLAAGPKAGKVLAPGARINLRVGK
jgi:hypothetical protein